jgi:uncharacterized repeat protein (TIGR01451 family)
MRYASRQAARALLSLVLLHAAADVVRAAEAGKLEVTTIAEVRKRIEPRPGVVAEEFVPAGRLVQGQEIFYTVSVRNRGPAPAGGVLVTKKIPSNTRYVPGSATGPAVTVTFSVDEGRTFAPPNKLTVADPQGRQVRATVDSYTHIRWQLKHPLAQQAIAYTRFRAVFK